MSWDQAINEIGDKMLEIRAKSGADSVYLLGSRNSPTKAVSVPQVRGVLGHQLGRPPGPHLPLHHRRRRRQYLGLRRDDQLLQRHRNSKTIVFMGRMRPKPTRYRCSTS
jgi:hypothetical protein